MKYSNEKSKVLTANPIAQDSPDYLHPWGVRRDNSSSIAFIEEVEKLFGRKINFLDLGCAGGLLAYQFYEKEHFSIGLEGSDYILTDKESEGQRKNQWLTLHNKVLWTCDVSHPFRVVSDNDDVKFDLITAWEVIEHITPLRFETFLQNIKYHLAPEGFFVGSISMTSEKPEGVELHQSIHSEIEWKQDIFSKYFKVENYPFQNKVRDEQNSFFVKLSHL